MLNHVQLPSRIAVLATAGTLALAGVVAGCGSSSNSSSSGGGGSSSSGSNSGGSSGSSSGGGGGGGGTVGVLLPDTKSSVRWETVDRPLLQKDLTAGGAKAIIDNAQGDKSTQQQQAEQMLTNGAKVLLLVNLDSGSGAAIAAEAKAKGAKVIDYDRLTLNGDSDYYVSFDNVQVGKLQGQGLVKCLGNLNGQKIAELNGSPTDNNATLFKQGYDSVLNPLYKSGKLKKVADQSVPDWDNQKALTIYEQMLQANNNAIQGVDAANDGLANSVVSAQKARHLPQIPVTGQDATLQGIQNILNGDQCMTVYKAISKEASAASAIALDLLKNKTPSVNSKINNGKKTIPAQFETPVPVFKDTIKKYLGNIDFPKASDICAGKVAAKCKAAGVS